MLLTSLLALAPTLALLAAFVVVFRRRRSTASFLQLVGAVCLVIVVLTHVCEALHVFPSTEWGRPHSVGHYLDLASAVLGLTLIPVGYALSRLRSEQFR